MMSEGAAASACWLLDTVFDAVSAVLSGYALWANPTYLLPAGAHSQVGLAQRNPTLYPGLRRHLCAFGKNNCSPPIL